MADYQQALQELMRKRQMAQPSPEDMAANDKQNQLGILLNELSKSQAMMGNIGGKPTESTGVDFQDYGKLASAQMAQKNLLANQNFDQGLQAQTAGMQADKFAGEQAQAAHQAIQQPILEDRATKSFDTEQTYKTAQIGELQAKAQKDRAEAAKAGLANSPADATLAALQGISKKRENAKLIRVSNPQMADQLEKAAQIDEDALMAKNAKAQTPEQKQNFDIGKELRSKGVAQLNSAGILKSSAQEIRDLVKQGKSLEAFNQAQLLMKPLNSALGADATGAEEVKRIGAMLEIVNTKRALMGGKILGPDMDAFLNEVETQAKVIEKSANALNSQGLATNRGENLTSGSSDSASINMKFPDGKIKVVPSADAEKYKAMGGVVQ